MGRLEYPDCDNGLNRRRSRLVSETMKTIHNHTRISTIVYLSISIVVFMLLATSNILNSTSNFDIFGPVDSVMQIVQGSEGDASRHDLLHVEGSSYVDEPLPDAGLKQKLPEVIIIGTNKCGTHALIDMMSMHSKIVKAPYELEYFSMDAFYEKGVYSYKEKMPYALEDQIVIEKSPQYFRSYDAPYRIFKYNNKTKLILLVKEPFRRLLSGYAQVKYQMKLGIPNIFSRTGKGKLQPFENLVFGPEGKVNNKSEIVTDSIYWPHLKHYLEVFPRDQILVLDGDALVEDPIPVVEKVEDFLDISREITRENLYYNVTKGFWCLKSEDISGCLQSDKGRKHEEVKPEVITKLRKFYAPHNERFYEISGINFKWPVL